VPYTAQKPPLPVPLEELRARIPGWGADLDRADRPSYPREVQLETGAHWHEPEQQPETYPRERSIEHGRLTPVFGTPNPPRWVSGAVRRLAYRRYSEARAAHWLLLIAADRIDSLESQVEAIVQGRPDNLLAETGIRAERWGGRGRNRADLKHVWMDPLVVAGPWVARAALLAVGGRRLVRATRRRG
jgi:hypothetical protein